MTLNSPQLQVKPRNVLTQVAGWTRFGLLTRTGPGTCTLAIPATPPLQLDNPANHGLRPLLTECVRPTQGICSANPLVPIRLDRANSRQNFPLYLRT